MTLKEKQNALNAKDYALRYVLAERAQEDIHNPELIGWWVTRNKEGKPYICYEFNVMELAELLGVTHQAITMAEQSGKAKLRKKWRD